MTKNKEGGKTGGREGSGTKKSGKDKKNGEEGEKIIGKEFGRKKKIGKEKQKSKVKVRRRFSINFKLHCVRQSERAKNVRKIAITKGITRSTLRAWIKNKTALEQVKNRSK